MEGPGLRMVVVMVMVLVVMVVMVVMVVTCFNPRYSGQSTPGGNTI